MRRPLRKTALGSILFAVILLALAVVAEAQQPSVYRIGVLVPGEAWYEIVDGLRLGLRELGLEERKQFTLTIRDWKGDIKAAEEAARNLEQEKANIIFATSSASALAAK